MRRLCGDEKGTQLEKSYKQTFPETRQMHPTSISNKLQETHEHMSDGFLCFGTC